MHSFEINIVSSMNSTVLITTPIIKPVLLPVELKPVIPDDWFEAEILNEVLDQCLKLQLTDHSHHGNLGYLTRYWIPVSHALKQFLEMQGNPHF